MLDRIDHVGVAVEDIDAALKLYEGAFGMPMVHRETVAEQGVEAVLLDVGEGHVELLSPLGEETPVGKFLARKGPASTTWHMRSPTSKPPSRSSPRAASS